MALGISVKDIMNPQKVAPMAAIKTPEDLLAEQQLKELNRLETAQKLQSFEDVSRLAAAKRQADLAELGQDAASLALAEQLNVLKANVDAGIASEDWQSLMPDVKTYNLPQIIADYETDPTVPDPLKKPLKKYIQAQADASIRQQAAALKQQDEDNLFLGGSRPAVLLSEFYQGAERAFYRREAGFGTIIQAKLNAPKVPEWRQKFDGTEQLLKSLGVENPAFALPEDLAKEIPVEELRRVAADVGMPQLVDEVLQRKRAEQAAEWASIGEATMGFGAYVPEIPTAVSLEDIKGVRVDYADKLRIQANNEKLRDIYETQVERLKPFRSAQATASSVAYDQLKNQGVGILKTIWTSPETVANAVAGSGQEMAETALLMATPGVGVGLASLYGAEAFATRTGVEASQQIMNMSVEELLADPEISRLANARATVEGVPIGIAVRSIQQERADVAGRQATLLGGAVGAVSIFGPERAISSAFRGVTPAIAKLTGAGAVSPSTGTLVRGWAGNIGAKAAVGGAARTVGVGFATEFAEGASESLAVETSVAANIGNYQVDWNQVWREGVLEGVAGAAISGGATALNTQTYAPLRATRRVDTEPLGADVAQTARAVSDTQGVVNNIQAQLDSPALSQDAAAREVLTQRLEGAKATLTGLQEANTNAVEALRTARERNTEIDTALGARPTAEPTLEEFKREQANATPPDTSVLSDKFDLVSKKYESAKQRLVKATEAFKQAPSNSALKTALDSAHKNFAAAEEQFRIMSDTMSRVQPAINEIVEAKGETVQDDMEAVTDINTAQALVVNSARAVQQVQQDITQNNITVFEAQNNLDGLRTQNAPEAEITLAEKELADALAIKNTLVTAGAAAIKTRKAADEKLASLRSKAQEFQDQLSLAAKLESTVAFAATTTAASIETYTKATARLPEIEANLATAEAALADPKYKNYQEPLQKYEADVAAAQTYLTDINQVQNTLQQTDPSNVSELARLQVKATDAQTIIAEKQAALTIAQDVNVLRTERDRLLTAKVNTQSQLRAFDLLSKITNNTQASAPLTAPLAETLSPIGVTLGSENAGNIQTSIDVASPEMAATAPGTTATGASPETTTGFGGTTEQGGAGGGRTAEQTGTADGGVAPVVDGTTTGADGLASDTGQPTGQGDTGTGGTRDLTTGRSLSSRATGVEIAQGTSELLELLASVTNPTVRAELGRTLNARVGALSPVGRETFNIQGQLLTTEGGYSTLQIQDAMRSMPSVLANLLGTSLATNNSKIIDAAIQQLVGAGALVAPKPAVQGNVIATQLSSIINSLPEQELALLNKAVTAIGDDTQIQNPVDLVSAVIASDLAVANGNPTTFSGKVSKKVRAIIDKIKVALGTLLLAVSLNFFVPPSDAVAQTGYGTIQTPTTESALSQEANVVNAFAKGDAKGESYLIVDQTTGAGHLMTPRGKLKATMPVLMQQDQTTNGLFYVTQRSTETSAGDMIAVHRVVDGKIAGTDTTGGLSTDSANYKKNFGEEFKGRVYAIPNQKTVAPLVQLQVAERTAASQSTVPPRDLTNAGAPNWKYGTGNPSVDTEVITQQVANAVPESVQADSRGGVLAGIFAAGGIGALFLAVRSRVRKVQIANGQRRVNTSNTPGLTPEQIDAMDDPDLPPTMPSNIGLMLGEDPKETRNAFGESSWWQRTGALAQDVFFSADASLLRGLKEIGLHQGGQWQDVKAWKEFKRAGNKKQHLEAAIQRDIVRPMLKAFVKFAVNKDIDSALFTRAVGTYAAAKHIALEGNRVIRQQMVNTLAGYNREFAQAEPDSALAKAMQEGAKRTQKRINDFDGAEQLAAAGQQWWRIYPDAKFAGGYATAEAQALMEDIYARFGVTDTQMSHLADHLYSAVAKTNNLRAENGTLSRNELAEWQTEFGFQYYVPLTSRMDPREVDVFEGTSTFATQRTIAREGAGHRARTDNAVENVFEYMRASVRGVAYMGYKNEFASMEQASKASDSGLMFRSVDINTALPKGVSSYATNNEGTRKYFWANKAGFDGADIINQDLASSTQPTILNPGIELLANSTRFYSKLLTVYRPIFAPMMAIKEPLTRVVQLGGKDFVAPDGTHVASRKLVPSFVMYNMAGLLETAVPFLFNTESKNAKEMAQARKELQVLGGYTEQMDAFSRDGEKILTEIHKLDSRGAVNTAKNALNKLDNIARDWNALWSQVAITSQYRALVKHGVSKEDAAFYTLQSMNYGQRGEFVRSPLGHLYAFANPAFQETANIVELLSTKKGWMVFAGLTATSAIAYSMLMSMWAMAMGLEEDDENPLDVLPLRTVSRGLILPTGDDGTYAVIPSGFGVTKIAWTLAAAMHRAGRGKMSADDAVLETIAIASNELTPFSTGNMENGTFIQQMLMAITPNLLTPPLQHAMGIDSFGNRLVSGSGDKFTKAKDIYASNTPDFYLDLANSLGGIVDVHPEVLQHYMESYLVGPAAMASAAINADSAYRTGRELIGNDQWTDVMLRGMGVTSIRGKVRIEEQQYYGTSSIVNNMIKDREVPMTRPENVIKAGITAKQFRRDNMLDAGFDMEQVSAYELTNTAEEDIKKINATIKQLLKESRGDKPTLDREDLTEKMQSLIEQRTEIMRMYNEEMAALEWRN